MLSILKQKNGGESFLVKSPFALVASILIIKSQSIYSKVNKLASCDKENKSGLVVEKN